MEITQYPASDAKAVKAKEGRVRGRRGWGGEEGERPNRMQQSDNLPRACFPGVLRKKARCKGWGLRL